MAITVNTYNHLFDLIGAGTVKEGDTFKAALMNSSHVFTATNTAWANVSANEITAGNGYTAGGATLAGVVILDGAPGSPWKIDFNDLNPGWTASGGSIGPYTDLVIYDDTTTSPVDALLYSIDLDGSFTAADGAQIKVLLNAAGLATVT